MNTIHLMGTIINAINAQIENANSFLREQQGDTFGTVDELAPDNHHLAQQLLKLSSWREKSCVYPPSTLPATAAEMIPILRSLYKDDITSISLVLHHHFPDDYLFYRVGKLEKEISQGFLFFSDSIEEFDFGFDRLRRTRFDDYLARNASLLKVGRLWWPEAKNLQARIDLLLYEHFARLFLDTSDYNRYWICSTQHDYWKKRHDSYEDGETNVIAWSGRKDMQAGDIVFLYCSSPVKAVTDIYYVYEEPRFDPYGAWDGVYVDLAHIKELPNPISFQRMRADSVLSQWSVIRRQFQGVVTESVPHSCYNRLVSFLTEELRQECDLLVEPESPLTVSGQFSSEEEFEDVVIEPLLGRFGLNYRRQVPCRCDFGTQKITGFIDFLVTNSSGVVTLIENKLKIISDEMLQKAVNQGKSYSLMLGVPSFVVASPEGCKLYSLEGNKETLVSELRPHADKGEEEKFLSTMLKLQGGR